MQRVDDQLAQIGRRFPPNGRRCCGHRTGSSGRSGCRSPPYSRSARRRQQAGPAPADKSSGSPPALPPTAPAPAAPTARLEPVDQRVGVGVGAARVDIAPEDLVVQLVERRSAPRSTARATCGSRQRWRRSPAPWCSWRARPGSGLRPSISRYSALTSAAITSLGLGGVRQWQGRLADRHRRLDPVAERQSGAVDGDEPLLGAEPALAVDRTRRRCAAG